jgi:hypothetical protein
LTANVRAVAEYAAADAAKVAKKVAVEKCIGMQGNVCELILGPLEVRRWKATVFAGAVEA